MEALLIEAWLGDGDVIAVLDDASVSEARQRARDVADAQSMSAVPRERLATIASELARNHLAHARRGRIAVRAIVRDGERGVEIAAVDEGQGIADPTQALLGSPRATGSLGIGLAAVREHAHELDLDVRLGEGTFLRARVFEGAPARRREVGIFGRPHPEERVSGDHAWFSRDERRLLVAVCDGLGHGPQARAASGAAMEVTAEHRASTPRDIIEACHGVLGPTRGAVMAVAALEEVEAARLDLASVGNVTAELVRPRASRRFGATSFVIGSPQRGWRAHFETTPVERDETLVLYSDGIRSRASIADDLALLREHPIVIAHAIATRFARDDDDVLVLVAR